MADQFEQFKRIAADSDAPLDLVVDNAAVVSALAQAENVTITKADTGNIDKRQLAELAPAEAYDAMKRELLQRLLQNQQKDFFYEKRKIKSVELLCRDLRVALVGAGLPAEAIHAIFYNELRPQINRLALLEETIRPNAAAAQEEMQLRQRIVSTAAARYFSMSHQPLPAESRDRAEESPSNRPPYRDSYHEDAEDQQRLQVTTLDDQAAFVRENRKASERDAVDRSAADPVDPGISAVENSAAPGQETATLVREAHGVLVDVVQQVPYYREQLRYAADGATLDMTDARRAALYAANNILLRGGQLRKRLTELQVRPQEPGLTDRIERDITFIMNQRVGIESVLSGMRNGEVNIPPEKSFRSEPSASQNEQAPFPDRSIPPEFLERRHQTLLLKKERTPKEDDELRRLSETLERTDTVAVAEPETTESVVTKASPFTYAEPDPALFERRDWQTVIPIEPISGAAVPNDETVTAEPVHEVPEAVPLGQEEREASLQDSDAAWLRAAPEQVVELADKMREAEAAINKILETIQPVIVDAGYYRRDTAGNEQSMALADVRNKLQSLQNRLRIMQGGSAGEARTEEVDALSTEVAHYRQTADTLLRELAGMQSESAADTETETSPQQLLGLLVPNESSGPFAVRAFRDALTIEWQPIKRAAEERNDATARDLKAAFQEIFSLLGYVPDTGITKAQAEQLAAVVQRIGQPTRIVGDFAPTAAATAEPVAPAQPSAVSSREGMTGEVLGDEAVLSQMIDVTPVGAPETESSPVGARPESGSTTPVESVLSVREAAQASQLRRLPAFLEKLRDSRTRKVLFGLGAGVVTALALDVADGSKKQRPSFESAVGTNVAGASEVAPSRPLTIDGVPVTTAPLDSISTAEAAKVPESPYTFIGARNAAGEVINTVSEAALEFWQQHPDVLKGVALSKNGFLRAMYGVLDRAEKDPVFRQELTNAMRVTSGDLDIVYEQVAGDAPRSTIDLQPLFNAIKELAQ